MRAAAQRYLALSPTKQKAVQVGLCERALAVWEAHFARSVAVVYRESVTGTTQELEIRLPREALACVRSGQDIANLESRYREPLTALQDHDLDFPDQVEMAYYAIRNAFASHVLKREVDPWLVVNQALAAIGEADPVQVLEEILDGEA